MVASLRRVADKLESSSSPSREAIVAELKKLAYATPATMNEMETFLGDAIVEWCDHTGVDLVDATDLVTDDRGLLIEFGDGQKYKLVIERD